MSTASQALREVQAFARMFKNVLALEEELKAAGSLDGLIAANKAKAEGAAKEAAKTEAALVAITAEYQAKSKEFEAKIKDEFAAKRAAAQSVYERDMAVNADLLSKAKAEIGRLDADIAKQRAAAKDEAAKIVHDAKARAQALDEAMKAKGAAMDADLQAAEDRLSVLRSEIADAQSQLSAARAEIARLKTLFAQ